jgi:hypothetical protein
MIKLLADPSFSVGEDAIYECSKAHRDKRVP